MVPTGCVQSAWQAGALKQGTVSKVPVLSEADMRVPWISQVPSRYSQFWLFPLQAPHEIIWSGVPNHHQEFILVLNSDQGRKFFRTFPACPGSHLLRSSGLSCGGLGRKAFQSIGMEGNACALSSHEWNAEAFPCRDWKLSTP